jgi:hypothetical protein
MQIQRWLAEGNCPGALPQLLVEHMAGCAACRGVLLLLVEAFGSWPVQTAISCDACQEQLAPYIDAELDGGGTAAWRAYPTVGWHLLICPSCAETYKLTCAMLDAEQSGRLTRPPALRPSPQIQRWLLATIHLTRVFLQQALPTQLALLGAARGMAPEQVLLYESDEAGHLVSLSVEQQRDTSWTIVVAIDPPIDGRLTLTLGDFTAAERFHEGRATLRNVPAAALEAPTGPDLLCLIERDSLPEG